MNNNLYNDCIELIFNGIMYFASKTNVAFDFSLIEINSCFIIKY